RGRARGAGPTLRRAAHASHRHLGRRLRIRQRAPARLRPLGGAQAREHDGLPAAPRRGGRDRDRAGHAVFRARRVHVDGRRRRRPRPAGRARAPALGRRARRPRRRRPSPRPGRARRVPRAPRRRADRHAAARDRPRFRGERDGRGVDRGRARPVAGSESSAGRASRFVRARHVPERTWSTRGRPPMRLDAPGRPHLTYCTNIHAGETWAEVRRNLEAYVVPTARRVAGGRPFGVGLRLSGVAAEELSRKGELDRLRDFLATHDLYVFTINGFPYGPFHGTPVKENVSLPDWLDPERVAYTNRLADLLAALLPDGVDGTISTV